MEPKLSPNRQPINFYTAFKVIRRALGVQTVVGKLKELEELTERF